MKIKLKKTQEENKNRFTDKEAIKNEIRKSIDEDQFKKIAGEFIHEDLKEVIDKDKFYEYYKMKTMNEDEF